MVFSSQLCSTCKLNSQTGADDNESDKSKSEVNDDAKEEGSGEVVVSKLPKITNCFDFTYMILSQRLLFMFEL